MKLMTVDLQGHKIEVNPPDLFESDSGKFNILRVTNGYGREIVGRCTPETFESDVNRLKNEIHDINE